jgi:hypothetical protein
VITKEHRRWAYGLLAMAVAYLVAVYAIPGFLASSAVEAASAQCVPHHKVSLDHGEHDGRPWRITASIDKIERHDRCSYWFLKVKFVPQGVSWGSWIEGWGIPAGGHLPATATIDARDYEEEDGRAVGGVVGSRVRSVVLELSGRRTMVVYPKDPGEEFHRRFVWLHGLRYFLDFYPAGKHIKTAKLLDANGKVIYTAHSQEGELVGSMVY